jgi:hypothetical protein
MRELMIDTISDSEDNYRSINDNCSSACWCRQLRQWISRQCDRNLDILTIDTYYRLNQKTLVKKNYFLVHCVKYSISILYKILS